MYYFNYKWDWGILMRFMFKSSLYSFLCVIFSYTLNFFLWITNFWLIYKNFIHLKKCTLLPGCFHRLHYWPQFFNLYPISSFYIIFSLLKSEQPLLFALIVSSKNYDVQILSLGFKTTSVFLLFYCTLSLP